MSREVKHGMIRPPRFQIVTAVFAKPTEVEQAHLRRDRGPTKGRRLAAVIESSPEKQSGQKRTGRVIFPTDFAVAAGIAVLLRRQMRVRWVVKIDAARLLRGRFFRADAGLVWKLCVLL